MWQISGRGGAISGHISSLLVICDLGLSQNPKVFFCFSLTSSKKRTLKNQSTSLDSLQPEICVCLKIPRFSGGLPFNQLNEDPQNRSDGSSKLSSGSLPQEGCGEPLLGDSDGRASFRQVPIGSHAPVELEKEIQPTLDLDLDWGPFWWT